MQVRGMTKESNERQVNSSDMTNKLNGTERTLERNRPEQQRRPLAGTMNGIRSSSPLPRRATSAYQFFNSQRMRYQWGRCLRMRMREWLYEKRNESQWDSRNVQTVAFSKAEVSQPLTAEWECTSCTMINEASSVRSNECASNERVLQQNSNVSAGHCNRERANVSAKRGHWGCNGNVRALVNITLQSSQVVSSSLEVSPRMRQ